MEYPFCVYPAENEARFWLIGRVTKEKGVDELREAAERMKKQHSDVFFDGVGPLEHN